MVDFWQIIQNAAVELISPTTAAYALAALGLAIHFGYTGLLNFGQAGFMAIGAYGYAISTLTLGFPVWGAVLVGVGGSIIFALILGIPTLRLRADYLAIVTIAASEILRLIFTTNSLDAVTGSADGLSAYKGGFAALNPFPKGTYGFGPFTMNEYDLWVRVVGWTLVILGGLLAWQLMRSPWGRVIKGIREDEDAVRALGKNVYFYKMQSLIIGGVFGTLGGMIFIMPRAVVPANYATTLTFFIYTILLLGGVGSLVLGIGQRLWPLAQRLHAGEGHAHRMPKPGLAWQTAALWTLGLLLLPFALRFGSPLGTAAAFALLTVAVAADTWNLLRKR